MDLKAALKDTLKRIDALLRAGHYPAAQDELTALVTAHPDFIEGLRLLGATKQALGDIPGAEQLLRRAVAMDGNWTPALTSLGELLLTTGRAAEAEPLLARAATANPPLPRAALLLARHYNDTSRPAEALKIAHPLVSAGRADTELAAQHIAALAALGRPEEAVALYQRLLAAAPTSAALAQGLALALSLTGRHQAATQLAAEVLKHGHRSATLYHTYARGLLAQGENAAAEAALRECLRLEPRRIEAHNTLAQLVWLRSGDLTQATATLDEALARFSHDDALWAAKAAILQGAGAAQAAYECLAARAARAEAPPALLLRAGLAALEFDPATARALAGRALTRVPDNASARTLLAAAELGTGEPQRALEHCEALRKLAPDDQYLMALETTAWRLLGDARYGQACDYPALVVPYELEPPAGWSDLNSFLGELRTSLNRLHDPNGHALLFQSLRHGTETTADLTRSNDPVIQALFRTFAAPIEAYMAHIGAGEDGWRRRNSGRWRFNGAWSVRLHSSGFHTSHVHPRGWISSACYIELPETMGRGADAAGTLTFGEPGIITQPKLASEHAVRPRVGMLVLFPSYFWHATVPFVSAQARLTVAFDVVPAT